MLATRFKDGPSCERCVCESELERMYAENMEWGDRTRESIHICVGVPAAHHCLFTRHLHRRSRCRLSSSEKISTRAYTVRGVGYIHYNLSFPSRHAPCPVQLARRKAITEMSTLDPVTLAIYIPSSPPRQAPSTWHRAASRFRQMTHRGSLP